MVSGAYSVVSYGTSSKKMAVTVKAMVCHNLE